jgi:hypothetical protein
VILVVGGLVAIAIVLVLLVLFGRDTFSRRPKD